MESVLWESDPGRGSYFQVILMRVGAPIDNFNAIRVISDNGFDHFECYFDTCWGLNS